MLLITQERVAEIVELRSTHEADTKMMIHVKHAASKCSIVIIVLEDTNVFVILLALHRDIIGAKLTRMFLRRGKKNRIRLIDISRFARVLSLDLCKALIRLHAFTGCDSVSVIAGQGRVIAMNLVLKSKSFKETFMALEME